MHNFAFVRIVLQCFNGRLYLIANFLSTFFIKSTQFLSWIFSHFLFLFFFNLKIFVVKKVLFPCLIAEACMVIMVSQFFCKNFVFCVYRFCFLSFLLIWVRGDGTDGVWSIQPDFMQKMFNFLIFKHLTGQCPSVYHLIFSHFWRLLGLPKYFFNL